MTHAGITLIAAYDVRLVFISVMIAIIASYTALDLAGRVTQAQGRARQLWLAGGAIAMGVGIWSMHFVAMLAFVLPMPMSYDVGLTVLSLMLAILATGGGFYVISRPGVSRLRLVLSRRHAAIYDISETASVVRWVAVRKAAALHRHRGLANRRGHRIVTYWAEGGGGEALKWALPCAPD